MSDLLPCPFCGRHVALCILEDEPDEILCAWINCTCGVQTSESRTLAEAVEKWNDRKFPPAQPSDGGVAGEPVAWEGSAQWQFAQRLQAYLDDAPLDGRHSDMAGGDAYDLIAEAIEWMKPALPPVPGNEWRETLAGQINAIYGSLDAEDCAWIDREWAKMRGYILPTDGTSAISRSERSSPGEKS